MKAWMGQDDTAMVALLAEYRLSLQHVMALPALIRQFDTSRGRVEACLVSQLSTQAP